MHEREVADIIRSAGIRHVISLPCDRTKDLCALLEQDFIYIPISREEDGIGICSGLALAGTRCILQMQSSGLGNSLNALMTLPCLYELPLVILASWRGYYNEQIVAQVQFNRHIPELLALYQVACTIIHESDEIARIGEAIDDAYARSRPHVILVSPKVWEGAANGTGTDMASRERVVRLDYRREFRVPVMQRADAIRVIGDQLSDDLVVTNLGVPSKELHAAADRDGNFYMLGSYTQATPIGLGIALGTKKRVLVLDGDGSLLGTAVLATVSQVCPENLVIIGLDNGVYGSTGNQCSPAYAGVDLELLAQASGISRTVKVHTPDELERALGQTQEEGPWFIHVVLKPGNSPAPNIPLSPEAIRSRFQSACRI